MIPSLSDLLGGGSVLVLAGIVVKATFEWFASRRSRRANDDLAVGSVAPKLREQSLAASDAETVTLGRQMDAERTSYASERETYERRLAAQAADLQRVTAERDALLATVERLRAQVETLQTQLDAVKTQLDAVQQSIGDRPPPTD